MPSATQLQLGADAAALAVAASCAEDESTCASMAEATANGLIAANGATPVIGAAAIELLDLDANTVRVAATAEFPHFLASLIDS